MTDGEEQLREQIKILGEKFLLRTADQVTTLRAQSQRLRAGDREALGVIQELTHKIHGSGAMFGFADLSERAGEIERLVFAGVTGNETLDQMDTLIDQLGVALEATRSIP
jgi:HPt (histidine-containing phosphotransfer) domain-containing protein